MFSVQAFYYISAFVIFALAWLGGGHTERTGVALYLSGYIASFMVQGLWFNELMWAVALIDLLVLSVLIHLALRRDRWWPLVAAAFQSLIMLIYVATVLMPELSPRSGVAASWALNVIVLYCLLGGVLERIMAGETPVSASAIWTPVRRPPRTPEA